MGSTLLRLVGIVYINNMYIPKVVGREIRPTYPKAISIFLEDFVIPNVLKQINSNIKK